MAVPDRERRHNTTRNYIMANMLSPYRRQIGLALKIETIAKLDKRAREDGSSRNEVAECYLSSALSKLELDASERAKVDAEIRANLSKRKGV